FWDWNLDTGRVRRHEGGSQTPGDALDVADCDVTQWMDDYHPDDRAAVWQCFEDHLDGRTANYSIECRIRAGGAGYRWIEERGAVVKRDAKGKPVRLTGVNIDISERRKTEAERIELEAQLRQAQKMESVGRLAGGVAHDFNNMLGLILGHAELAIEQVGQGQALREDLEEIRTAATRSAALTRQLLAFARKQTIAPKVLDLNETVTGVVAMLRRLVGEEIDIRWQPGVDLWPINMDPSQIEQMLANLSVNARDAIAGVGTLTIRTDNCGLGEEYCAGHPGCVPGQYVRLEVCDTGCGMDEHTRTQAFEPFFTTKEAGHGTGLGLSMVYGVVKQNNGFVDLVSAPGLGTTFSIYLPRYVGASEEVEVVGGLRPARPGHATILLVEDEKPFLAVTKRVLERWGYTVLAAGTPAHAMRLAEAHGGEIDLLLTDVVMPEMNGETLSRTLLSRHPHLKCLFMSGYTADVLSRHGVMEGTTNFIQKPFTMEMMAAKLRETLGMDPD
ncbi:MAG: response regulator, partial [Acidobacteriota bacterium]